MEGWRKRIGRIASSFEAANKDAIQQQPQALPSHQPAVQERPSHAAGAAAARSSNGSGAGPREAQQVQWHTFQLLPLLLLLAHGRWWWHFRSVVAKHGW